MQTPCWHPCVQRGNPPAWVCRQQAARDYCNDKLLGQSLRQWQLSARWSRDSGWKEDLAFRHCSETMLITAMDSWRLVSNATLSGYTTVSTSQ